MYCCYHHQWLPPISFLPGHPVFWPLSSVSHRNPARDASCFVFSVTPCRVHVIQPGMEMFGILHFCGPESRNLHLIFQNVPRLKPVDRTQTMGGGDPLPQSLQHVCFGCVGRSVSLTVRGGKHTITASFFMAFFLMDPGWLVLPGFLCPHVLEVNFWKRIFEGK